MIDLSYRFNFKPLIYVTYLISTHRKFSIEIRALCYKTCFVHNLRIFVIMFVPGKPSYTSLNFVGEAGAYTNEAPFRCFTLG
jgi:hypothetical protein